MDESTRTYRRQALAVLDGPPTYSGGDLRAQLQLSTPGGKTHHLRITDEELAAIRAILTGQPREVYAVQRESIDGLHAFEREEDRDMYAALLAENEIDYMVDPDLTINVMTEAQAAVFLAAEAESLVEDDGDTDEINAGTNDDAVAVDAAMWGES